MADGKMTGSKAGTPSKAAGTPSKAAASKATASKAAGTATKASATKATAGRAPAGKAAATASKAAAGRASENKSADPGAADNKAADSKAVDNGATDAKTLLEFIQAQTESVKKTDLEELSLLKLSRAAAALADMTDEEAPDAGSAVFLTAWKRADHCNHFWGPTVGQERFCTKCQVPHSAVGADADAGPPRRRS